MSHFVNPPSPCFVQIQVRQYETETVCYQRLCIVVFLNNVLISNFSYVLQYPSQLMVFICCCNAVLYIVHLPAPNGDTTYTNA